MKFWPQSTRSTVTAALACFVVLQSQPAPAWSEHVVKACSEAQSGGGEASRAVCHAYIEGFLDGALVTDSAIIKNVGGDEDVFSNYTMRALRTRVGEVRTPLPATFLADFCLPEDVQRSDLVTDLAAQLAALDFTSEPITEAVYRQVKERYPCPG